MLERIQKAQIVLLIVGLMGVFFGLTARIFRWLPLMGEEMYQEPLALSYGSWVFLTAGILCLVMVAVLWVTEKMWPNPCAPTQRSWKSWNLR